MNYALKYSLLGMFFGWFFVGAAWFFGLHYVGGMPTFASIIQMHVDNPVIGIVDTAPIVLGISFYFLGSAYQTLYAKNKESQDNSARFNALMNSAFDAIIIMDQQGIVLDISRAGKTILGYERQDVIGKKLSTLVFPSRYQGDFDHGLNIFSEIAESPIIGQRVEVEVVHRDGHEISVEVAIEKHRVLADGQANSAFVGFIHDITARKETAAQIIQASKLATLGEMATSVAHELNQPLSVIRMAAGFGRKKLAEGIVDPEYLENKLEKIETQTLRAAVIIDHMRMFGRKANEDLEAIDPRNVILRALDLVGGPLRLAQIEVVTEFAEDCGLVLGHPIQIEQVVLNLIANARDAIDERDGESKIITLRVFAAEQSVCIVAEDTGRGIPEDAIQRIFEPFYTTKEMGKGTGLGLSVSYGIIRDMNGSIAAENSEVGARFTITLPRVN
ncbi:MAG: PAS domain S-box protein [Porticoccaceae bacterium]|jgi:PAS domain S-box-containing protein|nr:PAS domain S-box protein [Porticoccaceae bacterium]